MPYQIVNKQKCMNGSDVSFAESTKRSKYEWRHYCLAQRFIRFIHNKFSTCIILILIIKADDLGNILGDLRIFFPSLSVSMISQF